ncbi:hypothetical protein AA0112_g3581 [Alternaria arborescens]|nr:hypothetical protein AA0111_g9003 [Alternaria arborescens]RYN39880.1 hypothetical protein AA0112_g3581 [Alternaria arborescens]RYO23861.1 hypothetical protein AA0111_g9003 [Alternaria arborescens]
MEPNTTSTTTARPSRATRGKGKPTEIEQMEDVAFTVRGLALQFVWPERERNKTIIAHGNISSTSYKSISGSVRPRDNFTFSEEELADQVDDAQIKVLVVGLTVPDAKFDDKNPNDKKHGGIVGHALPVDPKRTLKLASRHTGHKTVDEFEVLDEVDQVDKSDMVDDAEIDGVNAFLVATPCTDKAPTQTKMYVLGRQENGLCRLFNCPGEEVFYFAEFRDSLKKAGDRQTRWNRLVRAVATRQEKTEQSKLAIYGTPRDTTAVMVDPVVAFVNEVAMLTSAFSMTKDPWIMTKLSSVIDEVVPQIANAVRDHPNLKAFVTTAPKGKIDDFDSDMSAQEEEDEDDDDDAGAGIRWDAEAMLAEVAQRWPETAKSLTTQLLSRLRKGIIQEKPHLAPDEIEPLLRVAPTLDSMTNLSDKELVHAVVDLVRQARSNVPRQGGFSKSSISNEAVRELMIATINALVKISEANIAQQQSLQDRLGNDSVPVSPAHLWDMFGNTPDTDAARRLFDSFNKFLAHWHVGTADIINPMLTEVIQILKVAMGIKESDHPRSKKTTNNEAKKKKKSDAEIKKKSDAEIKKKSNAEIKKKSDAEATEEADKNLMELYKEYQAAGEAMEEPDQGIMDIYDAFEAECPVVNRDVDMLDIDDQDDTLSCTPKQTQIVRDDLKRGARFENSDLSSEEGTGKDNMTAAVREGKKAAKEIAAKDKTTKKRRCKRRCKRCDDDKVDYCSFEDGTGHALCDYCIENELICEVPPPAEEKGGPRLSQYDDLPPPEGTGGDDVLTPEDKAAKAAKKKAAKAAKKKAAKDDADKDDADKDNDGNDDADRDKTKKKKKKKMMKPKNAEKKKARDAEKGADKAADKNAEKDVDKDAEQIKPKKRKAKRTKATEDAEEEPAVSVGQGDKGGRGGGGRGGGGASGGRGGRATKKGQN